MRFWDSSALVPLLVPEPATPRCRRWVREDPAVLVWALTSTEIRSALCRRRRESGLSPKEYADALNRLGILESGWNEVTDLDVVRSRAHRLLETHPLRAMDALQLASALVAVEDRPAGETLVTLDARVAEAGAKEGFSILGV